MAKFIVMTACERMPLSCKGRYGKVAVVELEDGFDDVPAMISTRACGVKRIVEEWRRLNIGVTDKCAFSRALEEAKDLCDAHNKQHHVY